MGLDGERKRVRLGSQVCFSFFGFGNECGGGWGSETRSGGKKKKGPSQLASMNEWVGGVRPS